MKHHRFGAAFAAIVLACCAGPAKAQCAPEGFEATPYTVCQFDPGRDTISLFHSDADGALFGQFDRLAETLSARGITLRFAMNGGMYHPDRAPVGLYVENGTQVSPLSLQTGPGNFHMLPNGVFWLEGDRAGVSESTDFAASPRAGAVDHATQSGPMLVIDGELHPRFNVNGTSRYRRNGVGVSRDGQTVWLAISEVPVNLHGFARLFRDHLGAPNALYLDGNVSKLFAPELDRNERGLDMGPIIAVVSAAPERRKEDTP